MRYSCWNCADYIICTNQNKSNNIVCTAHRLKEEPTLSDKLDAIIKLLDNIDARLSVIESNTSYIND